MRIEELVIVFIVGMVILLFGLALLTGVAPSLDSIFNTLGH